LRFCHLSNHQIKSSDQRISNSAIQQINKSTNNMSTIGNLIWLVFGGIFIALEYFVSSLVLMITIIGIPFGLQTMKLGLLALWPFGYTTRVAGTGSGCLYVFMNVLWLFTGGIWICLSHLIMGLLLTITIVGIPFGRQHFKLASLALNPFGREVVAK
jgi:uncharacterized membrane protein YccF (DUF307 family)